MARGVARVDCLHCFMDPNPKYPRKYKFCPFFSSWGPDVTAWNYTYKGLWVASKSSSDIFGANAPVTEILNILIHSLKLTARTWKLRVGRLLEDYLSFWDGIFSGAMLVWGRVNDVLELTFLHLNLYSSFPSLHWVFHWVDYLCM